MQWLTSLAILVAMPSFAFGQVAPDKTPPTAKSESVKSESEKKDDHKIVDLPEEDVIEAIDLAVARAKSKSPTDFPALEKERKRRGVRDLGAYPHPLTVEALKKLLTGKLDPYLKGAAAEALGDMKFDKEKVAKLLVSRIRKEWKNSEVLIGIARGLGELGEVPDRKEMYRYFLHKDDEVYVSMIDCLGAMRDVQSLPKLLEIFSQYGKKSTAGISVRVDTGAPGTKDQQAAQARGAGALRKARANRRKGAVDATQQAVKRITGVKFEYPDKFAEWLRENSKRLKLELKKK